MDLSVLASQAVDIVIFIVNTATSGTLQKAGAEVFDLLKTRFQRRFNLDQAKQERIILEEAIKLEAQIDKKFQEDLERLVTQFYQVQNTSNVSQSTESGVNLNINHNPGKVIGQQFFR